MPAYQNITPKGNSAFSLVTWNLTNGDPSGSGYQRPGAADRSVQVRANAGGFNGGTVTIEGSNVLSPSSDADWVTLTDGNDNPLVFTTEDLAAVAENCLWYRAKITGGGGSEDVVVYFFSRRTL